jgi:hypothetical protein
MAMMFVVGRLSTLVQPKVPSQILEIRLPNSPTTGIDDVKATCSEGHCHDRFHPAFAQATKTINVGDVAPIAAN